MVDNVSKEFDSRFVEFDLMKKQIEFFNNPMKEGIKTQASEFQLELCDMQSDPFHRSKKNKNHKAFRKLISKEHFSILKDFALRSFTNVCEHLHMRKHVFCT